MVSHSSDNLNGRAMGHRRPGSGALGREREASDASDLRSQLRHGRDGLLPKINPIMIGIAGD